MWTIASIIFLCSGDGYKAQKTCFGWAIQGSRIMHGVKKRSATALAAMLTCCTTKKAVEAEIFSPEEKQRKGHSSKGNSLLAAVSPAATAAKTNLQAAMAAVVAVQMEEIDQLAAATTQLGTVLEPSEQQHQPKTKESKVDEINDDEVNATLKTFWELEHRRRSISVGSGMVADEGAALAERTGYLRRGNR